MLLSAEDAATLQAYIQGVDHAAREAEIEWGVDRLPLLVDAELRAKFNRQAASWQTAIAEAFGAKILTRETLDAVARKSAAMQRAWAALAQAASEAGHRPIAPDVWEVRLHDGAVAAIVQTNAEAAAEIASGRHLNVYTLAEVANIIAALPSVVSDAKRVFPGAKVEPPRGDRAWANVGDEIPF